MATSGSVSVAVTSYNTLKFNWSRSSYSIANNTSTISWNMQLVAGSSGYISSTASKAWSVTVNGTKYSGTNTVGISNNTTKTLASGTTTITHNADGTKSFSYSFSQTFDINFNGWIGTKSGSGSGVLDTIPRTSSVKATDSNIGDYTTITVSRASSSFTHTLRYSCLGLTGTILTKTSDTSVKWTLPTSFYAKMPNSKKSSGTIYCDTYSGGTLIGTTSCTFNIYVKESTNKPTLNPVVVDQGSVSTVLTGDPNVIIKYYNTINVKFNAVACNSATISSMKVTCGSKSRTSDGLLDHVDSGTFTFTVTDSRGFTVTETVTKNTIDYIPLTCYSYASPELIDNTNAAINLSVSGNYFSGSFGAVTNSLAVEYRYKTGDATYPDEWTTISATTANDRYTATTNITGLDYKNTYTIQIRSKDEANTGYVYAAEQVIRILPVFDWGKNDFNFNVPVHSKGGFTYDIPVGAYDVNATLVSGKYYLGSESTNRPINKNGWLEVQSYDNGNYCYQKFVVYTGEKYERWRNDGTWGDWIINNQDVLWQGGSHMNASQTVNFSSPISRQANGIQLIFAPYLNNEIKDQSFITYAVTKQMVASNPGASYCFQLNSGNYLYTATKELAIYDGYISGYANNTANGTNNGITYNNAQWVLRYVIGF